MFTSWRKQVLVNTGNADREDAYQQDQDYEEMYCCSRKIGNR